ncbi:hypothetical protein ACJ8PI_00110 [Serratia sp. CY82433]|uniref:hypothetical protein n=1 Tax=Serratia sp. CY82433 TaxID=3383689 RepID=UPI003FA0FBF8
MSYWEAKYRLLGGWRVLGLALNALVFSGGVWVLYLIGFFTRHWYNEKTALVSGLVMCTTVISFIAISRPVVLDKTEDEKHSLISLWWKRRKLEHLAKIKELSK